MNSLLFLEEISMKEFINDMKSMLLGVESHSFEYKHMVYILVDFNKKQPQNYVILYYMKSKICKPILTS